LHYLSEITLNVPREKVISYFDNIDNLKYWQDGFISHEHLEGNPGQPGAKSLLKYNMGKRKIEMVETITTRNFPEEFSVTYETKGVWNEVKNYFHEEGAQTRLVNENEFKFESFFMKMMGFLMPGAFKKQSMQYMENFKTFAEKKYREEKA
jgi:hypothetical protein